MATVYPSNTSFPPYFAGQDGDIYGEGCTFSYGSTLGPNAIFGESTQFNGDQCQYCDPYIYITGPVIIGKNSSFSYVQLTESGTAESIIGQPYTDGGSNMLGSATQPRPNHKEGGGINWSVTGCTPASKSEAAGKEVDPPKFPC